MEVISVGLKRHQEFSLEKHAPGSCGPLEWTQMEASARDQIDSQLEAEVS